MKKTILIPLAAVLALSLATAVAFGYSSFTKPSDHVKSAAVSASVTKDQLQEKPQKSRTTNVRNNYTDNNGDGICDNFSEGQGGKGNGPCDGTGSGNGKGKRCKGKAGN